MSAPSHRAGCARRRPRQRRSRRLPLAARCDRVRTCSDATARNSLPSMPADTITEDQFKADAQAFREANAKARREESIAWGEGSDKVGLLAEKTFEEELEEVRAAKEWRTRMFDAGF